MGKIRGITMWSTGSAGIKTYIITPMLLVLGGMAAFSNNQTQTALPLEKFSSDFQSFENIASDTWSNYKPNESVLFSISNHVNDDKMDIADIIDCIRRTLGLPSKDVAEIFKVTRQTLYNYKSDGNHNLHDKNLTRIKEIKVIVGELSTILCSRPGALTKTYLENGSSLFDLFKDENLDKNRIISFSKGLNEKMASKSKIIRKNRDDISLMMLTSHV